MDEARAPDLKAFDQRLAKVHLRGQWTVGALMQKNWTDHRKKAYPMSGVTTM